MVGFHYTARESKAKAKANQRLCGKWAQIGAEVLSVTALSVQVVVVSVYRIDSDYRCAIKLFSAVFSDSRNGSAIPLTRSSHELSISILSLNTRPKARCVLSALYLYLQSINDKCMGK